MSLPDSPLLGFGTPTGDEQLVPFNTHSIQYESRRQVKQGPGRLYHINVYSSNVAAQFIQIHDTGPVPSSGAVPATVFTVATIANLSERWEPGLVFLSGCWIVNSSTGPTYTAGAADTWFHVQFV